jgi:hypothetical protein
LRDLATARTFAIQSLDTEDTSGWNEAVRHRLARIERKMATGRPLFPSWPSPPSCGFPTSGRQTSS